MSIVEFVISRVNLNELSEFNFHIFIDCKLTSYRISRKSPLKRTINNFIMKYFEVGLYDKQLEWTNRLSDAIFETFKDKSSKEVQIVLTMNMAFEIFLFYVLGVVVGSFVFILEIIFKFFSRKSNTCSHK